MDTMTICTLYTKRAKLEYMTHKNKTVINNNFVIKLYQDQIEVNIKSEINTLQ